MSSDTVKKTFVGSIYRLDINHGKKYILVKYKTENMKEIDLQVIRRN